MATEPAAATTIRAADTGARFPCFDGLRAIAALAVFVAHSAGYLYYRYHEGLAWAPVLLQGWLARLGGFGVAVFFVISGFLLYRPFVLSSFRGMPSPRVGPFWIRRFMRIFPAYWVVVTFAIFAIDMLRPQTFADYLTFYGLLLNYRAGYAFFGLGVEWTLVIEVSYYIVLPALALGLRALYRSDAPVRTKYRAQLAGLATIVLAVTALRIWDLWIFDPTPAAAGRWFAPGGLNHWLISYLDWFAVGMLMAVVSAWIVSGGRLPRLLVPLANRDWLSWLLAVECYGLMTRVHYPIFGTRIAGASQEFVRLEMSILAAAFLVLPAVFGNQDRGVVRAVLRSRTLVWLGLISYGIYLWHVPIFHASGNWRGSWWFPASPMAEVVVIFVITVLAATASYHIVERPARIWAHRLTRPRRAGVAPRVDSARTPVPAPVSVPAPIADDIEPDDDVMAFVAWLAIAVGLVVIGAILPSLAMFGG